MKYEAPELTALTPAINAIQGFQTQSKFGSHLPNDHIGINESPGGYADWED